MELGCLDEVEVPTSLLDLPEHILTGLIVDLILLDLRHVAFLSKVSVGMRQALREALGQLQVLACPAALPPRALSALLLRAPRLLRLDLSQCFLSVSDQTLASIALHCTELRVLRLDHCCVVTEAGVAALSAGGKLPHLQELSLKSCGSIGDGASLAALPSLVKVSFEWCYSITSEAAVALGPRVTHLVLHGCDLVDDDVCSALPCVEELNLAFANISDAGLAALALGSPQLRLLTLAGKGVSNLWSCGRWSEAGLVAFRAARPDVVLKEIYG